MNGNTNTNDLGTDKNGNNTRVGTHTKGAGENGLLTT